MDGKVVGTQVDGLAGPQLTDGDGHLALGTVEHLLVGVGHFQEDILVVKESCPLCGVLEVVDFRLQGGHQMARECTHRTGKLFHHARQDMTGSPSHTTTYDHNAIDDVQHIHQGSCRGLSQLAETLLGSPLVACKLSIGYLTDVLGSKARGILMRHLSIDTLHSTDADTLLSYDKGIHAIAHAPHIATTAIVDTSNCRLSAVNYQSDSTATIAMEHQTPYNPDYVKYTSHSATDRLAVFSEVYYEPDWRAYLDGKPAPYLRANYILRAMEIPAGDHVIEFRNEAPLFHRMDKVTLAASIILVLMAGGAIFLVYRKKKQ